MKVRQLILILQEHDPELECAIQRGDCDNRPQLEINPQHRHRVLYRHDATNDVCAFDEGAYPGWTKLEEVLIL